MRSEEKRPKKKSARQLLDSEHLYKRMVESLPIYLYAASFEGESIIPEYYSPVVEKITGYKAEEFMADAFFWFSMVHPEDRDRMHAEILANRESDHHISEYRIIRKDGEVRWVRDQLIVLFDENGRAISYFGAVEDITLRRSIEEQLAKANILLEQANEMKAHFTKQLVHDIRSPLTSILGTLELLVSSLSDNPLPVELQRELMMGALKSVTQIDTLAENLLVVTKLEAGKYPVEKAPVKIEDLIEESVAVMSGAARARKIEIRSRIENSGGPLPLLTIDQSLMKRAIINLLSNAIKYTSLGGEVSIVAEADAESVSITVSDNGIGIAQEDLPYIFDIYWQSPNEQRKLGTGLGLAFVKLAVAEHGGEIKVKSAPEGGSQFLIKLPIH
jgi:PAS domain S-box-containing protein